VYGTRRNQLKREYDDTGKMSKKKVQIRIAKPEWQIIEHAHEAMIDREIFDAAQTILLSKSHSRAPRRAYHPLTGILFCGKCSQGMVCQKRSYKDKAYRYYICKTYHKFGRKVCNQANIPADEIEEAVINALRRQLERIPNEWLNITVNSEKDMERLQQGVRVNQAKKEKWKKDPEALKDVRLSFNNISQALFAKLLNMGIATVKRYETGAVSPNNSLLGIYKMLKNDPKSVKNLFEQNKGNFTPDELKIVEEKLAPFMENEITFTSHRVIEVAYQPHENKEDTGYSNFFAEKLFNLVCFFA
jgi:DNA-binding transcriptional regulator YiaG